MRLRAQLYDGMLMHALCSPDLAHDLGYVASIFTNKSEWKSKEAQDKELYNAKDVDVTLQIFPQLRAILRQQELLDVYELVSVPMGKVSLLLRKLGVKTDSSRIGEVRERLSTASVKLEESLPEQLRSRDEPCNRRIPAPPGSTGKSGKPVRFLSVASSERLTPWRSDKTVGEWLYGELRLPVQYHVKTKKPTTDKTALDKLYRMARADTRVASHANSILAVKKLRQIDETLTTFASDKMQYGHSIHTSFNVHGTNSGRLSSSDPNLQNVPEAVRCIYIPHYAGWKLIQADFSSIENRITAYLAHDTDRLARMNDPEFNEHRWIASQWYGIPENEIEKSSDPDSYYSKAKHINHGRNYGLGARKTSLLYDIPEKEVKTLMAKWAGLFSKTAQWQEYIAATAKKEGVLVNNFGRRRWFYTSSFYSEALSFLPQSTGAEIILRSMIALMYERINWPLERVQRECSVIIPLPKPANMLLTVHDSLLFEAPAQQVDEVVAVVRKVMEQPWPQLGGFKVPIAVEIGDDWGSMEKYIA